MYRRDSYNFSISKFTMYSLPAGGAQPATMCICNKYALHKSNSNDGKRNCINVYLGISNMCTTKFSEFRFYTIYPEQNIESNTHKKRIRKVFKFHFNQLEKELQTNLTKCYCSDDF